MTAGMIRVGSRGSALALEQAGLVRAALARDGRPSKLVVIETAGDRRAPDSAWGEGAFVAEIERALLGRTIDVAVHSAKDVPTDEDPRLRLAAFLPRADPRDALVVRPDATERRLDDLAPGSRIGTDSPRRTGFILARRPDLDVHPLHGNVDTRLRRLDAGEIDALVLAAAGLERLGLGGRIAEVFDAELLPPAPGQGAIAIQIRRDDARMLALAAAIDDPWTRLAVDAERSFLAASGGGCREPIGALAVIAGGEIELLGGYASPDGSRATVARRRGRVADGQALGRELALELGVTPAATASTEHATRRTALGRPRTRVLVTRARDAAGDLIAALVAAGLEPVLVPSIEIATAEDPAGLDSTARRLSSYDWVVVTSANGARAILSAAERAAATVDRPRWAVVGPATRRLVEAAGVTVAFEPERSGRAALAGGLPLTPGDRVLVVRGDIAGDALAATLRERGARVDDVIGYLTREAPERSRPLLQDAAANGPIAAAVFTSGSTVRGLVALGRATSIDVQRYPAICIGPETAGEASRAGFPILAVSEKQDATAVAGLAAAALGSEPAERR